MSETGFAEFLQILLRFDTASVVTRTQRNFLIGRPMAIADCTPKGHLWFITRVESSTVRDITENPQVAVCMQANGRYASISGHARTTRDAQRIEQIWDPRQAVWFEKGRRDPSLILLEIVPAYGEFWDRSGASGIDFALREIRALATGGMLDESKTHHASIDFTGDEPE